MPSTGAAAVSSPHFAPPGGQRGAYAGSRARQTPPAPSWTPRPPPPVGSCVAPYTLTVAPGALFSLFRALTAKDFEALDCRGVSAALPPWDVLQGHHLHAPRFQRQRHGGFVDADWASGADSRRSIGGYVFMINGGAVS